MIKESYKNRLKKLAGIIKEDNVVLKADTGRSDKDTLSWYSEDYLLNLGSEILTMLDGEIEKDSKLTLSLIKSSTKITANSLFINIRIQGDISGVPISEEFDITLTVQFESDSNTVASVSYRGVTNKFNLSSKHSSEDLEKFKLEIVDNVLNSLKISKINPKP
jgi:hypothetical protein